MTEPSTVGYYLHWKWHSEDDDGFNLVIVDRRRQLIESSFNELLKGVEPAGFNNAGIPEYPIEQLDVLWAQLQDSH